MSDAAVIAIVSVAGAGIITLFIQLINAKTKKDNIVICPLDRNGVIEKIKSIDMRTNKMDAKLDTNLDISKRSNGHYEDSVQILAEIKANNRNQTEVLKTLMLETRRQTDILIKISKNGHGL